MDRMVEEIINWIKRTDERVIIGISGHGAAGKTTFADSLVNLLGRGRVNYLNTDPYIVSSNVRKHSRISYTYQHEEHRDKMTACHPAAHHVPALERDVQMIRAGMDMYTIETPYMKSDLISSDNKVTIVEGMTVAFSNLDLYDLKIYFYTDGDTEFMRRSGRDISERGMELTYLKQSHTERRIQYEVFMHPYSERFDFIIKSSNEGVRLEKNSFNFQEVRSNSMR